LICGLVVFCYFYVLKRFATCRRLSVEDLEVFAGLEADGFAWGDADLGAGTGIAADAGLAGLDGKDAKTAQFDAVAVGEGLLHGFKDGVDGGLCLGAGKAGTLYHPLNEVLLDH
jgi:hypothetical protein